MDIVKSIEYSFLSINNIRRNYPLSPKQSPDDSISP
jgi:hypothetical protein